MYIYNAKRKEKKKKKKKQFKKSNLLWTLQKLTKNPIMHMLPKPAWKDDILQIRNSPLIN
jgi:hypothetical protein